MARMDRTVDTQRGEQTRILAATMRAISWQWQKQAFGAVERMGLTMPQVVLLATLNALGGRSAMRDLVQHTCQSGATLTGIVDRLIDAKLVARHRDEEDRRVVYVMLTDAGQAKLAAVEAQSEADMARLTADFSPYELEMLIGSLQKILGGLGQSDLSHPPSECGI